MPCRDGGPTPEEYMQSLSERLNKVTDMLCRALHTVSDLGIERMDDDIRQWWQEHLESDRQRLLLEEKREKIAKQKKAALAKLTPAERRLLGL